MKTEHKQIVITLNQQEWDSLMLISSYVGEELAANAASSNPRDFLSCYSNFDKQVLIDACNLIDSI